MASDQVYDQLKRKAVWAKKHIGDLDRVCADFIRSNPYTVVREHDRKTGEFVFKIATMQPIPPNIDLMAGDILFNLRSALDHAAFYFAGIQPHPPATKSIYFPIRDSAAKYMSPDCIREVQAIGHDFKRVVDAVKPYKGGNDALWKLHRLNNIDKHRLLVTVASVNYGRSETLKEWEKARDDWTGKHPGQPFYVPEGVRRFVDPANPGASLKAGQELLRISDAELNEKPTLLVDIAIDEAGIAEGELLVPLLNTMASTVLNVIGRLCK
jgi:hypothetical protein